jgi:hypothetical protein
MKRLVCNLIALTLFVSAVVGCSQDRSQPAASKTKSAPPSADVSSYLLNSEPEGGQDVVQVRETAKNDDEIVIVGRIGGAESPWVDGRAAFSIVDPSLKSCSDIPGDNCPTPWDYCCETDKLPTSTALVKVIDEKDQLINVDARELLKVKELQTVVIRGKAQRDEAGNLTVLAKKVYVRD